MAEELGRLVEAGKDVRQVGAGAGETARLIPDADRQNHRVRAPLHRFMPVRLLARDDPESTRLSLHHRDRFPGGKIQLAGVGYAAIVGEGVLAGRLVAAAHWERDVVDLHLVGWREK